MTRGRQALLRPSLLGASFLVLAAVLAPPAGAIRPHQPAGLVPGGETQLRVPRQVIQVPVAPELIGAQGDLARLEELTGARWRGTWDLHSGRPALLSGSGVPWAPPRGKRSALNGPDGLPVLDAATEAKLLIDLERRARALVTEMPELFDVPPGVTLRLDRTRSSAVGEGRVREVNFAIEKDGVPVRGGFLTFRLSHGNLVQLGAGGLADALGTAPTRPELPADKALSLARADVARLLGGGDLALSEVRDEGTLELLPWLEHGAKPDAPLEYRLAWRVSFRTKRGYETWVSHRDALTGEALTLHDDNRYACPQPPIPQGRVIGGVFVGPVQSGPGTVSPEVLRGMPHASVTHGVGLTTDYNGLFPSDPSQPADTTLSGAFFDLECEGCTNPRQALAANPGGGEIFLGSGGQDEVGNGQSTRAERNCFYHLGIARQLASKHLDDGAVNGFFFRLTPAVVNIDDSCNAFFDGDGVNFLRSSGACNNTGEIADVMQHEWGHGLDQFTGNTFDFARGEGMSDVVSFLSTHDPRLGPYFFRDNAAGLRNADEAVTGTLSPANLDARCPDFGNPPQRDPHCEGEIFSQAFWHLGINLRARYGDVAGWYLLERLFFQSLPAADTYLPDQVGSTYDALVLVDDDNGDILDGTPNGDLINEAFVHHGMAPLNPADRVTDSADCAPPAAPSISAQVRPNTDTGQFQVELTWAAVPGALEYGVYRNDAGGAGADVPVALISAPATRFLDDNVIDGVTYRYRVATFDTQGCVSITDNQRSVGVGQLVHLSLGAIRVDDFRGNFNGIPEPGEPLTLLLEVVNAGVLSATGVTAVLSTAHPGATVTRSTAGYRDLAAAEAAFAMTPAHDATILPGATCGDEVTFVVSLESAQGCAISGFKLRLGSPLPAELLMDMESDAGWIVDPAGVDTATGGVWVREDPFATGGGFSQPGEDHTPSPGVVAWVTGNSAADLGNPGDDDVDDGCTTVETNVFDMGMRSGMELRYWRYVETAGSAGDGLEVEISNDGGFSWVSLENVRVPVKPFTEVAFALDTVFAGAPADLVMLRFAACDRGNRSRVEALVDDLTFRPIGFACEAPFPLPRLRIAGSAVGDSAPLGGQGNGNGVLDPGESVRLAVDLENFGNTAATLVTGTMSIVSAPAGLLVSDPASDWPDVMSGGTERTSGAPAHFEIAVPADATCGDQVVLAVQATYAGPSGTYPVAGEIALEIGSDVDTVRFGDDFEGGDNGWIHAAIAGQDDWHHEAANGFSDFDPDTAHSGVLVWANDIGGPRPDGLTWDGNYRPNVNNYLESPSVDCTGMTGTKLSFWRWLSVENAQFDQARVLVNGVEVWRNPTGSNLLDTAWTYQEIDISAIADANPDVRVRFSLTSDGGVEFGGWNLEDVRIFTRARVCTPFDCGAPTSPGPVGPVLRATGVKGENGAEFSWNAAAPGAGDSFRLYRGTTPDSLPLLVTPIGLTALSYDDRSASGPLYFYTLVLANCAGAEGPATP